MPSSTRQKRREERTILPPHIFADATAENDNAGVEYQDSPSTLSSSPLLSDSFEASLHKLPRTLNSEVELVFPEIASQAKREKREKTKNNVNIGGNDSKDNESTNREYLLIPTFHVSRFSTLERNDRTEDERVRIFLRFREFAKEFRERLFQKDPGSQLDIPDIDGASTFSVSGRHSTSAYDEVASTRSVLGYSTFLYMGVQIVHHPRIGYEKLAIHTIVIYARSRDVEEIYFELLNSKNYRNQ
uniref:Uncharacterized protein n=1 Tax=Pseudo-nitzschia australis TaxID=44445 RepID=A0A7S4AXG0_9STRA